MPIVIDALGTVMPRPPSGAAQVAGVLQQVLFKEGQMVARAKCWPSSIRASSRWR